MKLTQEQINYAAKHYGYIKVPFGDARLRALLASTFRAGMTEADRLLSERVEAEPTQVGEGEQVGRENTLIQEILEKHIDPMCFARGNCLDAVYEAMADYASQVAAKAIVENELVFFAEYIQTCIMQGGTMTFPSLQTAIAAYLEIRKPNLTT